MSLFLLFTFYFLLGYYSYRFSSSLFSYFYTYLWIFKGCEYLSMFVYVFLLFKFILFFNFVSLFPYFICLTSQIWYCFCFSSRVIILVFLLNYYFDLVEFVIDFVPLGCPILLGPFLVVIEVVSFWIRLFTLSVRLMINLSAGHMLGHLLSGTVSYIGSLLRVLFFFLFVLYEVFVSFIQASVFSILVMIYFR